MTASFHDDSGGNGNANISNLAFRQFLVQIKELADFDPKQARARLQEANDQISYLIERL